ncbi:MAG TPA: M28 family peptidase [Thermoanaerobaculia bacterium]|nr:M28 family peptidase [Thermoanaerobaculia bacterium]
MAPILRTVLAVLVVSVSAAAAAADEIAATAARLRERALAIDHAYELARALALEVGPRLAGSDGDRRAVAWAERALAQAGLAAVRREAVAVPRWERGEAAARLAGPAAPLVVAALGGSVGTPEAGLEAEVVRFPSLAALAAVPPIPAAALALADADLLAARLETAAASGEGVRVWLRLTSRLLPDAESANLLAEVRGRERPEEIVLLGAHLDSWDLGPGALDDAAGVGIVVAAARLLAELPRHVLAVEADHGCAAVYQLSAAVPAARLPVVEAIAELLAPLGVGRGGGEVEGGSDLGPLREAGVPILALDQDSTRYFDVHHTADDTADKLDPHSLRQVVAAYAVAAWTAAEME